MNPAEIHEKLSGRERQCLVLAAHGVERKEMPEVLHIGEGTVKTHMKHAFRKLGALNAPDAVRRGFNRGDLTPCTPSCEGCTALEVLAQKRNQAQ